MSRPRPCALAFAPALGVLLSLRRWVPRAGPSGSLALAPPRLQGKRPWGWKVVQSPPVGLPAGSAGKSWDHSPQRSVSWMPQQSGLNFTPTTVPCVQLKVMQLDRPLKEKAQLAFP